LVYSDLNSEPKGKKQRIWLSRNEICSCSR